MTNEDYSECVIKTPQTNKRKINIKQRITIQTSFDRRGNLSHH